jgi:hypothetical protein
MIEPRIVAAHRATLVTPFYSVYLTVLSIAINSALMCINAFERAMPDAGDRANNLGERRRIGDPVSAF